MDKLTKAREEISAVDREMAALFVRRMNAVRAVSEYKTEHGLTVYDAAREETLLTKNASYIEDDELRGYYMDFQRNAMRVSRRFQEKLMCGMRVAFCGVEGAFKGGRDLVGRVAHDRVDDRLGAPLLEQPLHQQAVRLDVLPPLGV